MGSELIISNARPSPYLYIHFPVCKHHCSYCDFNLKSEAWVQAEWKDGFASLWLNQLKVQLKSLKFSSTEMLKTLYLGGGTPSLLRPETLALLIEELKKYYRFDSKIEITMEVNPENAGRAYLNEIRDIGVNRLSLGIQTTIASQLKRLERLATLKHISDAIENISDLYENYSFDLMIGIPDQTLRTLDEDLKFLSEHKPPHISVYLLTIADDHKWKKSPHMFQRIATSDLAAEFYQKVCSSLSLWGYEHYEVSNFSQPGFASRHNLNYWDVDSNYLGIGPGAHGYIKDEQGQRFRYESERDLKKWLTLQSPFQSIETLSAEQQRLEKLYLSLRTRKPVHIGELNSSSVSHFEDEKFLVVSDQSVTLTDLGWVLMESLADRLIP